MLRSRIIVIGGLDLQAELPDLRSKFEVVQVATPEDLAPAMERAGDAALLVYNRPKDLTAMRALNLVRELGGTTPVIVVVDQYDPGEYRRLMGEGAFDYFELHGDPNWLETALYKATRSGAAVAA